MMKDREEARNERGDEGNLKGEVRCTYLHGGYPETTIKSRDQETNKGGDVNGSPIPLPTSASSQRTHYMHYSHPPL